MVPAHPAIVGGVTDIETLSALPDLEPHTAVCDLLEFRVDALLEELEPLNERLQQVEHPAIITVRDPIEGGIGALTEKRRGQLLEAYAPHAALVDIEVRNLTAFSSVADATQKQGAAVIGSFHDFEGTPSTETLHRAIEEGRQRGADLIKLAVTLRNADDLHTLLRAYEQHCEKVPMAIMGMGPLGMGSRVLFAQCGNLLTYTFLQKANAPGQWSAQRMRALFQDLGIAGF